jgi:hypothetical protein
MSDFDAILKQEGNNHSWFYQKSDGSFYPFWEFGFDCNHYNDIAPLMSHSSFTPKSMTYKDKDWVIAETEKLARQFEEIEASKNG